MVNLKDDATKIRPMHSSIPYRPSQSPRSLSRIMDLEFSISQTTRMRKSLELYQDTECGHAQSQIPKPKFFPQSNASILRISFLPLAKSYSKFECYEILRKYETRDAWNSNTRLFCLSFFLIQQPIIHCTSESRNLRLLRPS